MPSIQQLLVPCLVKCLIHSQLYTEDGMICIPTEVVSDEDKARR